MLERHQRVKTARMLAQREPLDDTRVYRQFYAASALPESDVIELWHEIATMLGVPPGQLRPTNVLGRDIGGGFITTDELDDLGRLAEKRAISRGLVIDFSAIQTVDDYIKAFARTTP